MGYEFVVYEDHAGRWRWQLRSIGNTKIIADSGQGYSTRAHAEAGVQLIKLHAPHAVVKLGHLTK